MYAERKEQIEKVEEEERLWKEKEEKKRLEREKDGTKKTESETTSVGESKTHEEDNWKKNEAIENYDKEYKQGEGNDDDKIGNWEDSATDQVRHACLF